MDATAFSIRDALVFFETLKLNKTQRMIAERVMKEIRERLTFLVSVGLEYLSLDRNAGTCRAANRSASVSPRRSVRA